MSLGVVRLELRRISITIERSLMGELKAIADMMIRVGYEKECCQVYSNVSRDVLDECLVILGVEKLSIEWKVLDEKMKKWIQAVKVVVSPLAPQWYCLEGGDDPNAAGKVSGDVQLVIIMEAQDLKIAVNLPPLTAPEHGNLVFVAGEPLEDSLILLLEDRTRDDPVLLGHVLIPVAAIEQRS
ncbi:protein QUIRKY [Tanacetum coccineum]